MVNFVPSLNAYMKTAVIAGASGLTGRQLVRLLLEDDQYQRVISVGRNPCGIRHDKLEEILVDFAELASVINQLRGQDAFCCLGTTLRKAGSKERQYIIDHDFVVKFAKATAAMGALRFFVISSIGAATDTRNFYLRTKGEMERDIQKAPFKAIHIFRPSIIAGWRKDLRPGEKAGLLLSYLLWPLMLGSLRKYRPITAAAIARAVVAVSRSNETGLHAYESNIMQQLGRH